MNLLSMTFLWRRRSDRSNYQWCSFSSPGYERHRIHLQMLCPLPPGCLPLSQMKQSPYEVKKWNGKKKILPERISSIFSPQNSQCWGLCVNLLETMLLLYVLTANLELTVTVPGNLQKQQELKNRYEYSRETAAEIKKQTQKPITKSQKT